MKKIVYIISIFVSMFFLSSCELNDYPKFNDDDAFVGFASDKISVKEDADSLIIPVRLTSLGKKASVVTFEIIDSTAVNGVDFDVRGGANVLNFDGSTPVLNIELDILTPKLGEFTGDLIFGVVIKNSTNVNIGSNDTLYVTINDVDHPLSAILGAYNVSAVGYWDGDITWEVEFKKDPDGDVSKVWISNLVLGGANRDVYGIVNDDMTKIEIPVGQTIVVSSTYESIILAGFDDPDVNEADFLPSGSKLTLDLTKDSPVEFTMDLPFASYIEDIGNFYNIVLAEAKFTKQ